MNTLAPATAFCRLFHRPEASVVLEYLKKRTMEHTLSPNASNEELRFLEGQRALVAHILSLIKQGQQ